MPEKRNAPHVIGRHDANPSPRRRVAGGPSRTAGQWRRHLLGLAVVAALSLGASFQEGDVGTLVGQLRSGATQVERDTAALRLLSRPQEQAVEALRQALTDPSNPQARLAAARALAVYPRPEAADWVDPLFTALAADADAELATALGRALGTYSIRPAVASRLENLAKNSPALPVRLAAIEALSVAPTLSAAEVLAALTADPDPRVADAAVTGLQRLTGLADSDRGALLQWLSERQAAGDFEETVLLNRVAVAQQREADLRQARETLRRVLTEQYRVATDAPAMLRQYLDSTDPTIRLLGAELVFKAVTETGVVPEGATPRVISLVGDSRPEVRRQAAAALSVINEPAATEALLTQLAQEPDASVRAALATALGPLRDVRIVEPLLGLLRDPSQRVVAASARSLRRLGPTLLRDHPRVAREAAAELQDLLQNRTRPGDGEVREAAVEAYAATAGNEATPLLTRMLQQQPRESEGVLVAALNGLAAVGDDRSGDAVAVLTAHPTPRVRQAAVRALVQTSVAFERADTLRQRLDESAEPSAAVRDEAWKSLQALMPRAPEAQLAAWPDRFENDPRRKLAVYRVLAEKAAARGDLEAQGFRLQQIGDLLVTMERWGEAAEALRQSLTLAQDQRGTQPMVLLSRSGSLLTALLRDKQFDAALQFAGELIQQNPQYRGDVGNRIREEAERLFKENELADARRLVDAALAMSPPLERVYVERLRETQTRIEQRRRAGSEVDVDPPRVTQLDPR